MFDAEVSCPAGVRLLQQKVHEAAFVGEPACEKLLETPMPVLIDDDDLEVLESVREDAGDTVHQHVRTGARRNDHGNHWSVRTNHHPVTGGARTDSRIGFGDSDE